MRILVAIGIIILANCYSTFAVKNPMSSGDDIERMPMTAVEQPGNDTINDTLSNELPDTTTKRKILNCLNVRIM
jgi:hypothetical protein